MYEHKICISYPDIWHLIALPLRSGILVCCVAHSSQREIPDRISCYKPISVDTCQKNEYLISWNGKESLSLVFSATYSVTKSQSLHDRRGSGETDANYKSAFTECLPAAN